MGIKEIALRISEKADEYADAKLQSKGEFHPDWHTVRDEYFAEALIAELAKQNEPVAWARYPKYADGGFVSAMPQSINTGNPMVARVNNTDMITFARIVAQETRHVIRSPAQSLC